MSTKASSKANRSVGRRPGKSNASKQILTHAQKLFALQGYEHTTIRAVADAARVDPALVLHYYQNKQALFLAATLPNYQGPVLLQKALSADRSELPQRLAEVIMTIMEQPDIRMKLVGLIRASASEEHVAQVMKTFVEQAIIEPLTAYLDQSDAALRANVFGAQVVGICTLRYVTKVEPLASAEATKISDMLVPLLEQLFL